MKNLKRFFFFIIVLTIFAVSCIKEKDFDFEHITITENFSYDLALPLVDANMSLGDMLKSVQMAQTDTTGLLHLIYEDEFSHNFSDLALNIPEQHFQHTTPSKIPVPPGNLMPDSIVVTYTDSIFFNVADSDIRLDSISLESGLITMDIQTDIRNRIKLEISNSNIVNSNHKPLILSAKFEGTTSGGQAIYTYSDLSRYNINPIYDEPNKQHLLSLDYKITVYKDTNVSVPYLGELILSGSITNMRPDAVFGYFGKETYGRENGAIDLKILNRFNIQALELEKANMQIRIYNGIGLPVFMIRHFVP